MLQVYNGLMLVNDDELVLGDDNQLYLLILLANDDGFAPGDDDGIVLRLGAG